MVRTRPVAGTRQETRAEREELGAWLDECLRPRVASGHAKDGREATEVSDHVHELGNEMHKTVVVRDALAVAVREKPGASSAILVEDALDRALGRSLRAALGRVGTNARVGPRDVRSRDLDRLGARMRLDQEDRAVIVSGPHEVADEPAAVRQLVHELFGGALHGYLTPGATTSAYRPGNPGTSIVPKGPASPTR